MEPSCDCVVVGAGAAGLSAALVLGRARQRTLVIDAGRPSNWVAHAIGGLLGHDGRPPGDLYAQGRRELATYPTVEVRGGEVVTRERGDAGFVLGLEDGERVTTTSVLLATGMDYRPPDKPGLSEHWGRSVFHCPFCHGWEMRDRTLCVLDRGETGVHRALLLRVWSPSVTLLSDGPAGLDAEQVERLLGAGVEIDERRVARLRGSGDDLAAVVFDDGRERPCDGLLVPVTLHQRSSLAGQLGATASPPGPIAVDAIEVDARFQTSVPGVSAAGDVCAQMPSVANAIAAGSNAAAMIVGTMAGAVPR